MESNTLSEVRGPMHGISADHRRASRMRKVRPMAFVPRNANTEPALQTVTANVSRGGMLLVTRQDHFPPAGAAVLLMPFDVTTGTEPDSTAAIEGRIVYTRFSPKAKLRFAGLKFEQELPERAVRMLGLEGAPDAVTDAITTLEELEASASRVPMIPAAAIMAEPNFTPSAQIIEADYSAPSVIRAETNSSAEFAEAQREFILATAAYLAEWGEECIRRSVADRHALARAKGVEGLRAMKRDWTELRGRFRELTAAEIDLRAIRIQGSGANAYYNVEQEQPRAEIMHGLHRLAGQVGRILIRHGFDDIGAGDWTLISGERGVLAFTGAMGYSEAMRDALMRAADAQVNMTRMREQSDAGREQDGRAEALRAWDRA